MGCVNGACEYIEGCGEEPCFNDNDCPLKTACLQNLILGFQTCLPNNLPLGDDCSKGGDPSCAGGICLEEDDGSFVCSIVCQDDLVCPQYLVCLPGEDCRWACRQKESYPATNECRNDADCLEPRVCGLVADQSGQNWESRCVVPLICASQIGESCDYQTGQRCATNICAEGDICSAVCWDVQDCPEDFDCREANAMLPGGQAAGFLGCLPMEGIE
jgi:hypothetical protein